MGLPIYSNSRETPIKLFFFFKELLTTSWKAEVILYTIRWITLPNERKELGKALKQQERQT